MRRDDDLPGGEALVLQMLEDRYGGEMMADHEHDTDIYATESYKPEAKLKTTRVNKCSRCGAIYYHDRWHTPEVMDFSENPWKQPHVYVSHPIPGVNCRFQVVQDESCKRTKDDPIHVEAK